MQKSEELMNYINENSFYRYQLLEEYKVILDLIDTESKELKNIRSIYGQLERETFNAFVPIDKYWKEDFHEIILTLILNSRTREIGNIEYLENFLRLIYTINNNLDYKYHFNSDAIVENQIGDKKYGFIDILVYDKDKAIIIESKINGAEDQKNQLVRYYRYVKDVLKKDILAIVYIRPVDDENKMPPLNEYRKEFKKEVEIIRKLLVPIPIIDSKNQIDLCHGFLDTCYNKKYIDKANVFIKQYSELLKIMGGNKMTMNIEKEIFKKLFGDIGNVVKTADIGEIWNKRWLILGSIIQDKLVKEMKFIPDGDRYCYKKICEKLSYTFIYDPDSRKIGDTYIFGFSYDAINQKTKNELKNLLNSMDCETFSMEKAEIIDNWLIVRKFDCIIDKTFDEIVNNVFQIFKILEKKYTSNKE
jgi:hypothetical protein